MPTRVKNTNPKPFISFSNYTDKNGALNFVPNIREGGLTVEVLNTGNLKVLKDFYADNASNLNDDELTYLNSRIQTAEEVERLKKKALNDLVEGKKTAYAKLDKVNGFDGFSQLKYSDYQTSFNGCWSCAYSLLLKSRGVDLSQEQIRAWRPDYPKSDDDLSPAEPRKWYDRNADTTVDLAQDVDLLTQVLPDTAMSTFTVTPFDPVEVTFTDPKDPKETVPLTNKMLDDINAAKKAQTKSIVLQTINDAINIHHSPVVLSWDHHFVTVTGIDRKGNLRYQDSNHDPMENTIGIDKLMHITLEKHTRKLDGTEYIANPTGISLTWLHDIRVPEYSKDAAKNISFDSNTSFIKLDKDNKLSLDLRDNKAFKSDITNYKSGNVSSKGISTQFLMKTTDLEKKIGAKMTSFGPNGSYFLGNLDTYYPDQIKLKKDPNLVNEQRSKTAETCSNISVYTSNALSSASNNDLINDIRFIYDVVKGLQSHDAASLAKARADLKKFPQILKKEYNGKTVLENIINAEKKTLRSEVYRNFIELDDSYDIGINFNKALHLPENEVYTADDMKVGYELDINYKGLHDELSKNKYNERIASAYLLEILAMNQLRDSKYGVSHTCPTASDITKRKQQIKNSPAWDKIQKDGIANFVAMASSANELSRNYTTISDSLYVQSLASIGNNRRAPVRNNNTKNTVDTSKTARSAPKTVQPVMKTTDTTSEAVVSDELKGRLRIFDKSNRVSGFRSGNSAGSADQDILSGAAEPDAQLAVMKAELSKLGKPGKDAGKAILNSYKVFEKSYTAWKEEALKGNSEKLGDAIADVQKKTADVIKVIDKYIDKSAADEGKAGYDAYRKVLTDAKDTMDNVRMFMDDRSLDFDIYQRDIYNQMIINTDVQIVADKLMRLREKQERSKGQSRLFVDNEVAAINNIKDIAFNGGDNTLSNQELGSIKYEIGSLVFNEMCKKFPKMRSDPNAPKNMLAYTAAVDEIIKSKSFADLIKDMDRASLRHIITEERGTADLLQNFMKTAYLTASDVKTLSSKSNKTKSTASSKKSEKETFEINTSSHSENSSEKSRKASALKKNN